MEFLSTAEFWVAVAFVIFVLLAARPIGRAIAGALDTRSARIRSELDEAQRLRQEAERLLQQHQARHAAAAQEAEAVLAQARTEVERLRRTGAANLEASLARREQMALDKIAQAETQAVAAVRQEAVEVAIAATARLLTRALDDRRNEALLDASIAEIERKLQ